MNQLGIYLDDVRAGTLTHDPALNQFAFSYSQNWRGMRGHYPLSPHLPLEPAEIQTAEEHSSIVRQFFENLMPEGQALDDAARVNKTSKSNLFGLMVAIGKETAGAIRIQFDDNGLTEEELAARAETRLRPLLPAELSLRINSRPHDPFSVWDGKVRMSIAGFQDKISVYKDKADWFFVDGGPLASTVILKPEPVSRALAGLPSNEFFCMRLAHRVGLPVAAVRLARVPELVLEVDRFDRIQAGPGVRRLHVIDGCQALGISAGMKYERPYGESQDVKDIRDGASLPQIFRFLHYSSNPAKQRLDMLRWTIFQILIGNTDAHAKNISFFCTGAGFDATPAYDLVSTLALNNPNIEDSFAMAIGDAFTEDELTPYEWTNFAVSCDLRPQLVEIQMMKLLKRTLLMMGPTAQEVVYEGADPEIVRSVCEVIERMCEKHRGIAKEIKNVDPTLF
jgi:serine/threonine-protein kinase HipA